jgi:hypothetical protein
LVPISGIVEKTRDPVEFEMLTDTYVFGLALQTAYQREKLENRQMEPLLKKAVGYFKAYIRRKLPKVLFEFNVGVKIQHLVFEILNSTLPPEDEENDKSPYEKLRLSKELLDGMKNDIEIQLLRHNLELESKCEDPEESDLEYMMRNIKPDERLDQLKLERYKIFGRLRDLGYGNFQRINDMDFHQRRREERYTIVPKNVLNDESSLGSVESLQNLYKELQECHDFLEARYNIKGDNDDIIITSGVQLSLLDRDSFDKHRIKIIKPTVAAVLDSTKPEGYSITKTDLVQTFDEYLTHTNFLHGMVESSGKSIIFRIYHMQCCQD